MSTKNLTLIVAAMAVIAAAFVAVTAEDTDADDEFTISVKSIVIGGNTYIDISFSTVPDSITDVYITVDGETSRIPAPQIVDDMVSIIYNGLLGENYTITVNAIVGGFSDSATYPSTTVDPEPEPETVTITFMVDEDVYATVTVQDGAFVMPENPTMDGYDFVGWFTADDVEFTIDTVVTESITVHAHFVEAETPGPEPEPETVTITFMLGDEEWATVAVEDGAFVMPESPTMDGYDFVGWFTADDVEFTIDTVVTESITVHAHFVESSIPEPGPGDDDWSEYTTITFVRNGYTITVGISYAVYDGNDYAGEATYRIETRVLDIVSPSGEEVAGGALMIIDEAYIYQYEEDAIADEEEYGEARNAGTYYINITFRVMGENINFNHKGVTDFVIVPATLGDAVLAGPESAEDPIDAKDYTGSEIELAYGEEVVLWIDGVETSLVCGTQQQVEDLEADFYLAYADNTAPGTATVTAVFSSNFTNESVSATFDIEGIIGFDADTEQTSAYVGQVLDLDELTLTATTYLGETIVLSFDDVALAGLVYDEANGEYVFTEDGTVVLTFTFGDFTDTVEVEVVGIESVSVGDYRDSYQSGDAFDTAGMYISVTYEDGLTAVIRDNGSGFELTGEGDIVSGFVSNPGDYVTIDPEVLVTGTTQVEVAFFGVGDFADVTVVIAWGTAYYVMLIDGEYVVYGSQSGEYGTTKSVFSLVDSWIPDGYTFWGWLVFAGDLTEDADLDDTGIIYLPGEAYGILEDSHMWGADRTLTFLALIIPHVTIGDMTGDAMGEEYVGVTGSGDAYEFNGAYEIIDDIVNVVYGEEYYEDLMQLLETWDLGDLTDIRDDFSRYVGGLYRLSEESGYALTTVGAYVCGEYIGSFSWTDNGLAGSNYYRGDYTLQYYVGAMMLIHALAGETSCDIELYFYDAYGNEYALRYNVDVVQAVEPEPEPEPEATFDVYVDGEYYGTYAEGDVVAVTGEAPEGEAFVGWMMDGVIYTESLVVSADAAVDGAIHVESYTVSTAEPEVPEDPVYSEDIVVSMYYGGDRLVISLTAVDGGIIPAGTVTVSGYYMQYTEIPGIGGLWSSQAIPSISFEVAEGQTSIAITAEDYDFVSSIISLSVSYTAEGSDVSIDSNDMTFTFVAPSTEE